MTDPTSTASGGRPRQFTDEDILRATVALVEADGLGKLTMRRLGAALGVEAMAIYRYFPSRQSLITALVDWIVLQTASDPELQFDHADSWRDYLDRLAHGIRQMALTHPRVFPIIASTPTEAPWIRPPMRSLQWVDSFLTGLQDHDFPPPAAVTVYKQFSSFLLGHLLLEVAALGLDDAELTAPGNPADSDRRTASRRRREAALRAERVMRRGDGPSAEEILESDAVVSTALAEEPAVIAAEPRIAAETSAAEGALDSVAVEADIPVAAAVPSTHEMNLDGFPQVQALAGLLAQDTAPTDFERQLDRLLDDLEHLRRP